jgi:hypothetical protein
LPAITTAATHQDVQELVAVVKQLVKLQAIANQKLDAALSGKPIFDTI